jgi:NAD(P)-dependent dehydrogenase (short-subunit alcohol dehydrogenase family)
VIIFAGARKSSAELEDLATKHPDKVKIIKLTSGDEVDNKAAVAAVFYAISSVLETSAQAMAEHFDVNTIGPLVLFQATYPLLKASSDAPKFIPISGAGGSILYGAPMGYPTLAGGVSKAALNYLTVKIRADHEGLGGFLLL